jgi:hypothetical protein
VVVTLKELENLIRLEQATMQLLTYTSEQRSEIFRRIIQEGLEVEFQPPRGPSPKRKRNTRAGSIEGRKEGG